MFATKELLDAFRNGDVEKFNQFLQEFHDTVVETTLRSIPAMVGSLVKTATLTSQKREQFYKDHPQYQGKEEFVSEILAKVDSENPGAGIERLIELALPELEKSLKSLETADVQNVIRPSNETLSKLGGNGEL